MIFLKVSTLFALGSNICGISDIWLPGSPTFCVGAVNKSSPIGAGRLLTFGIPPVAATSCANGPPTASICPCISAVCLKGSPSALGGATISAYAPSTFMSVFFFKLLGFLTTYPPLDFLFQNLLLS